MSFAVEKSRTIISAMILGRKVTAQDVAWLRREVFADGEVTRETADELFAVARARMNNAPEWVELFVELMTDYVVWQLRPTGVVTDEEAQWLIGRADECKSIEALAALNVVAGKITGHCFPRHRHQEFLHFLRQLDAEYATDQELHLILDNYGTHKSPQVQRWLARHPRFKVHFIPTSSSWLNLVERWFGDLTGKAVRRGSFTSVPDLIAAIEEFITAWNHTPKPFIWQAKAEDILVKIERCRRRLEQIQPGCTLPKRRKKAA